MCKYVDETAWLLCWAPRGQQVFNLRKLLYAGDTAHKQGNQPWLRNPGQTPQEVKKPGESVALQKGLISSIFFKKSNGDLSIEWFKPPYFC